MLKGDKYVQKFRSNDELKNVYFSSEIKLGEKVNSKLLEDGK